MEIKNRHEAERFETRPEPSNTIPKGGIDAWVIPHILSEPFRLLEFGEPQRPSGDILGNGEHNAHHGISFLGMPSRTWNLAWLASK